MNFTTDYDDSDHRHDVTTAMNQLKLTVTVTTMKRPKSRDLTELRNMVLFIVRGTVGKESEILDLDLLVAVT